MEQLLYPEYAPSLFGLFHSIPHQDIEGSFPIERGMLLDGRDSVVPNAVQISGRCAEEAEHGFITVFPRGKTADYGGDPQLIKTDHQTSDQDDEPVEGSFAGEAEFEAAENIF